MSIKMTTKEKKAEVMGKLVKLDVNLKYGKPRSFAELTKEITELIKSSTNVYTQEMAQALLVESAMKLDEHRQAARKGGLTKSPKKEVASKSNGKRGGRKPMFGLKDAEEILSELARKSIEDVAKGRNVAVTTIQRTLKRYGLNE